MPTVITTLFFQAATFTSFKHNPLPNQRTTPNLRVFTNTTGLPLANPGVSPARTVPASFVLFPCRGVRAGARGPGIDGCRRGRSGILINGGFGGV